MKRIIWLWAVCLLCSVLPVQAQDIRPSELVFQGVVGDTLQRTVTISAARDVLQKVSLEAADLIDPDSGAVILKKNVTVDPVSLETLTGQADFTITITGVTRSGRYQEQLILHYDGQPASQPTSIGLQAIFSEIPQVEADENSVKQILSVQQNFGNPSGSGDLTLYFLQKGSSPAQIIEATIMTLRSASGQSLDANVLTIPKDTFPISLSGSGGVGELKLGLQSEYLPPGEYNGTLAVRVKDQPQPVLVPLTIRIKQGLLIPLLILLAGLLTPRLFSWWRNAGSDYSRLAGDMQRLAKKIDSCSLQASERSRFFTQLRDLGVSIENRDVPADIQKGIEALSGSVQQNVDTVNANVLVPLNATLAQFDGIRVGKQVLKNLRQQAAEVETVVKEGRYPSLQDAQENVASLQADVKALSDIDDEFQKKTDAEKAALVPRMDSAASVEELRQILAPDEIVPAGRGFGRVPPGSPLTGKTKLPRLLRTRTRARLLLGGLLVTSLPQVLLFIAGLLLVYGRSPTFGADPNDYISLFLWGTTVEALGAQPFTLTSFKEMIAGK